MNQFTIKIDGVHYNPYEILGVSKNNTDSEIKVAFNKRVKRYHPDKCPKEKREDYSRKYNIVIKSYDFIKNKRSGVIKKTGNDTGAEYKELKADDLIKFNNDFEETKDTSKDPNQFGYGDHKKISSIEDYTDLDIKIEKQFKGKEFDPDEFNKLFEYLNVKDTNNERSLIHKTTDDFYGYNTSNFNNCASVASYNGLMVYGDDQGQSGVGYWDSNYSDYKSVYNQPKQSLDNKIKVPDDYKREIVEIEDRDFKTYRKEYESYNVNYTKSRSELERELMESTIKQMERESEKNKEFLLKYNTYDNNMITNGLNGELEASASYLEILRREFKSIKEN